MWLPYAKKVLWNMNPAASKAKLPLMPAKYSLAIIHPSLELLKNLCRLLHLIAAIFIAINALHQLAAHEGGKIICYTQLVIAADILILVFFGAGIFIATPKIAVLFRVIEAFTFMGIFLTLVTDGHPLFGVINFLLSIVYGFIAYREWRIANAETIDLLPNGIHFPNFLSDAKINWLHIKKVVANYNSILIETVQDKKMEFELRNNLKIEELQQINDFCTVHSQLSD
jgi:hypothetical protein